MKLKVYRATDPRMARLVRLSTYSYGRGISEMDQIRLHSLQKALAAAVVLCCTATVTPAFAQQSKDRNPDSPGLGYAKGRVGSAGAPAPIAGAGLPFLALTGAYALVRRRRNRNRPEQFEDGAGLCSSRPKGIEPRAGQTRGTLIPCGPMQSSLLRPTHRRNVSPVLPDVYAWLFPAMSYSPVLCWSASQTGSAPAPSTQSWRTGLQPRC